jgi:hypothetical protein
VAYFFGPTNGLNGTCPLDKKFFSLSPLIEWRRKDRKKTHFETNQMRRMKKTIFFN